jgi:alpha-L-fucosidase
MLNRTISLFLLIIVSCAAAEPLVLPIADGPFKPSWESLQQYQTPDWFKNAKFGIWAHWGPQCQPEDGDWYAQRMYLPGHRNYQNHVTRYGHPSEFGFKDIIPLWKAERFDPDKLLALYKKAGAQYFVAMANHHDNFDNWNSKYQPWNSVALGPKQDLIGKWAEATRKAGLRFGVSLHMSRAWDWYEVAQLSDDTGPKAGVPYDGNLTKADGAGKWWEGLDPQDLYAQRHKSMSDPRNPKSPGNKPGDRPSPAYAQKYYNRAQDVVDTYQPDLVYFDEFTLPMRNVDHRLGLSLVAHIYNANMARHGGRNEAVVNLKNLTDMQRKCLVMDIERGVSAKVEPLPWQTDTCIGDWHYNRERFVRHSYRKTIQVVQMLVDIVSKNGNLLLSVPMRGDGTIDEDEEKILEGIAAWMQINGEAIYDTQAWTFCGEGPSVQEVPEKGEFGAAKDVRSKPYTAEDFRFTRKDGNFYAIAMAWPTSGKVVVKTLATNAKGMVGEVRQVSLLGHPEKLSFTRTEAGLEITLPAKKPCDHAFVFKVTGLDLSAS